MTSEMEIDAFIEAVLKLVFASFFVERSLSLLFETKAFIVWANRKPNIRTYVAFFYSLLFVFIAELNLIFYLGYTTPEFPPRGCAIDEISCWSYWCKVIFIAVISAGFIAGGSKASLKLFRDVMQIRSYYESTRTNDREITKNVKSAVEQSMDDNEKNVTEAIDDLNEVFEKYEKKNV